MKYKDINILLENAKTIVNATSGSSFANVDVAVQLIDYIFDHKSRLVDVKVVKYNHEEDYTILIDLENKFMYCEYKYSPSMIESITIDIDTEGNHNLEVFLSMTKLYEKRCEYFTRVLQLLIDIALQIADE